MEVLGPGSSIDPNLIYTLGTCDDVILSLLHTFIPPGDKPLMPVLR